MPVPYNELKDSDREGVVQRYVKYLNGPMGKNVMDNVDEGESFVLETSTHKLRVTKVKGKAIVDIIQRLP